MTQGHSVPYRHLTTWEKKNTHTHILVPSLSWWATGSMHLLVSWWTCLELTTCNMIKERSRQVSKHKTELLRACELPSTTSRSTGEAASVACWDKGFTSVKSRSPKRWHFSPFILEYFTWNTSREHAKCEAGKRTQISDPCFLSCPTSEWLWHLYNPKKLCGTLWNYR